MLPHKFANTCAAAIMLVSVVTIVGCFDIEDCTAGKPPGAKLKSVSISSCPDVSSDECEFPRGSNATIQVDFESVETFSQANIAITAIKGVIKTPFVFDGPKDACGNYGFDCPVKPAETVQLKFSLPVKRAYPRIHARVRFQVADEKARPIICIEFPVHVE